MNETSGQRKGYSISNISDMVLQYKKQGLGVNEIMNKLSEKYDLRSILESFQGDRYIIHSIISEKLVVIDKNNKQTDGVVMLNSLINEIR